MKRIAVLTSGGDAPGMNAAIRAAVRCGIEEGLEVYGVQRGYEGLMEGDLHQMDRRSVGDILQRGGTLLKSARSSRFRTEEGQLRALDVMETFGIDGLIAIGGDGTLHGARDLSRRGFKVMGLPGTIDNDLGYTDFTIGFDTAVATVLEAITKIRDTSSSHERISVIEVMGRHCGDIALYAGLAGGAETILVPEIPFDINELCRGILEGVNAGKLHNIIIKAEGVEIPTQELTEIIERKTGRETRPVVLSYLQRGGSPTMRDRILATECAAKAVKLLVEESESKAIGTLEGQIVGVDLEDALEMKSEFNMEMYELMKVLGK